MSKLILLACLASALYMTGLIWFVQVVHYPLFDRVGLDGFRTYHAAHSRLTSYVVLLPMVIELGTSFLLVADRPEGSPTWLAWLGLALAVATWGVTFFLSVPAHGRLAGGFDPEAYHSLVSTNILRALAWTGHSAVVLAMTARAIR